MKPFHQKDFEDFGSMTVCFHLRDIGDTLTERYNLHIFPEIEIRYKRELETI